MKITVPELALVTLIGASGSGKSTFAKRHFKETSVLSSDYFRGLVSDDENNQDVSRHAFEALHFVAAKRLELGRLTVVDATNVQSDARRPLIELAKRYHCIPVAIVLNIPERVCIERNRLRADRTIGAPGIRRHTSQLKRSLKELRREGFRHIYILRSEDEVDNATFEIQPLWNNRRGEQGPFDIIGDVHGCFDELSHLLTSLGYHLSRQEGFSFGVGYRVTAPSSRKAIFLGDLVDRGPNVPEVLRLVMSMCEEGKALCVPGNHDVKLVRKLLGKGVQVKHGLAESLEQLEREPEQFVTAARGFLDGLVSHYVLHEGRLVVAHAGMKEEYQGRGSGRVREFALFGETTGEIDEFGLPVRYNWAEEYRGGAMVVYGHTPVPEPEWLNHTINIDTGCVFGGKLTALRYPERELYSVPARRAYAESVRPITTAPSIPSDAQRRSDDLLDIRDVIGKRYIRTALRINVSIREENAVTALETMSRFAADPRWLIYLPPTMSPCETSSRDGFLEHPHEAFEYYRSQGVLEVVCEEKHMGSRGIIVLCRTEEVAARRFGVATGERGICYTRTGRRFFDDPSLESLLLERLLDSLESGGLFDELKSDWVCLDCEILPWSLKAQDLLRHQYAAVGCAAHAGLTAAVAALTNTTERAFGEELLKRTSARLDSVERFIQSYRRYCWPVNSIEDIKVAPFHILASEGAVHCSRNHKWHLSTISKCCGQGVLRETRHIFVDPSNEVSVQAGIAWWEELVQEGGEGMVVKPSDFIVDSPRGLVQPGVKCRGPEYLRIIYGAEYTAPEHLNRLRSRGLSAKRSLALREFALGMEGLQRFVNNEPLRSVHECVFGVLALESEAVDPRL